jgi:very-short-patch-repair endonuclease
MSVRLSEQEAARLGLTPRAREPDARPARRLPNPEWARGLCTQLRALGLEEPAEAEYRWHPTRKWTADLAVPRLKLLVEIDGGSWSPATKHSHSHGKGFERDRRKDAAALLLGWRTLRVTPAMVKDDTAITTLAALLGHPLEHTHAYASTHPATPATRHLRGRRHAGDAPSG